MTAETATRNCANGPAMAPQKKSKTVPTASTSFAIWSAVSRFFVITDKHQIVIVNSSCASEQRLASR